MKTKFFRYSSVFLLSIFMIFFMLLPDSSFRTDAAGLSLGVSSSMSSRYIGGTIKVTAEVSGGRTPYNYKFLYKVDSGSWYTLRSYSTTKYAQLTTTKAGKYTIRSYVKDGNNTELYCDLDFDVLTQYVKPENKSTVSSTSITKGNSVTVKGLATGGTKPYYFKYYYLDQNGTTKTVRDYSTTASQTVKFDTAGYYTMHCTLKDKDGKVLDKSFNITVKDNTGKTLKNTSTVSPAVINKGEKITVNASSTGGYQPCKYEYYYSLNNSAYKKLASYTESSKKTFTLSSAGFYKIKVIAKDLNGKTSYILKDATVKYNTRKTMSMSGSINTTNIVDKNTTVIATASAAGGVQPYQYSFRYKIDSGEWVTIKGFSATATATLKLTGRGKYTIQAIAKDANGTQKVKSLSVTSLRIKETSDITTKLESEYGLSLNHVLTSPGAGAKYQVYSRDPDSTQWQLVRSYSTDPDLKLRPRVLGTTAYMVYTNYNGSVSTSYFTINAYIPDKAYQEVELLNVERRKAGLSDLKLDPDLQFVANVRAEELDTLYDHVRPDGSNCFTVIEQYNIKTPSASGENIAWGYKNVNDTVSAWMKSERHRENILNPKYTKIGAGNYLKYWSQMFTS